MYDVSGEVMVDASNRTTKVHLHIDNNLGTTWAAEAEGDAIPALIQALSKVPAAQCLAKAIEATDAMITRNRSGSIQLEPFQLSRIYDVRCVEDVPGFQLKVKDLVPV